jgi:hypothetical protein
MSTDTPLSAAASAAENAAFPAPTTTTSADDGNIGDLSFPDSHARRIDRGAGASYTSETTAATTYSFEKINAMPAVEFAPLLRLRPCQHLRAL